jgi:MscS family membrane protein
MEKLESLNFLGNPLLEWAIALAYILGSVILARIVYRIFSNRVRKWTAGTETEIDDVIVDAVEEPISLSMVLLGFWLGYSHLNFPSTDEFMAKVFNVAVVLTITWLASRVVNAMITHLLSRMAKNKQESMVNDMAPILKKTLGFGIWCLGLIMALKNAGHDVGPLLAGAGIGGIAMAMAAKDFVANIFGGITVFIDRPFRMGDRVKISGIDGTVVEIGIRSTRISTLEGRLVTIPNNQFTNSVVENVTAEPSRKVRIVLGLTYDTQPETIDLAISILKRIVDTHPHTEEDVTVWFSGFGDFSLNVNCNYYINKKGHWANTPSEINLSILKEFNENKLDFAFPTQTIILDK